MGNKNKKLKGIAQEQKKQLSISSKSTDGEKMVWIFSEVDNDGDFKFDPHRDDFNSEDIFDKLIYFSKRTWGELRNDTHDDGKSKHHFLADATLSKKAEERISRLKLEESRDQIYSLRLTNKCRIIGLRDEERFIVKWYDPEHGFCPGIK